MGWFNQQLGLLNLFSFEIPFRELTYPPFQGTFEDDVPFPQVGYVSELSSRQASLDVCVHLISLAGPARKPQMLRSIEAKEKRDRMKKGLQT